ncbi:MAG: DUF2225 domain-containing protein [Defluviitaleaceae bacterium]|nr:DUF2225 domain-containing protein [Defluviitaleaceae bacterium]
MFNIFAGLDKLGFTQTPEPDAVFNPNKAEKSKKKDAEAEELDIAQYVLLKKRLCPVCNKIFSDVMLRKVKCRFLHIDSDLRARYHPFDPIYYDVILCHFCGYTAMHSHFDQISEKQIDLIFDAVNPQYQYKEYPLMLSAADAAERYLLALLCATIKRVRPSEKAMLCLRLAWLLRDQKEAERELEFLLFALQGFELAYENENFPMYGMESETLCYLIGELCRRVGRHDDSMRHLSRVITSRSASNRLKERARDIRDLIKKQNPEEEL